VTPPESTFSDIFLRDHAEVISVGGAEIRRRLVLPAVPPGSSLTVRFVRHHPDVPQGLNLSTNHGKFVVEGERNADVVLWTDTAPEIVELQLTNQVPAEVVIWNAWRGWGGWPAGSTGYAGMMVKPLGPAAWRLECSDGVGGPDFTDLVVEVRLSPTPDADSTPPGE
jgi:hypothetical protein